MTNANTNINLISVKPNKSKSSPAKKISKIVILLLMLIYTVWVLLPFVIIILTSFTSQQEVMATMGFVGFPKQGWVGTAYAKLFRDDIALGELPQLIKGFINTLWIVIPSLLVGLFSSGLAAFAYSKLRFKAKGIMYAIQISTMMLPMSVMTIPSYMVYDIIGWTESPLPLMIPGMFGSAVTIFFFRQYFASVPDELISASKIDGLGYFGIYIKILMPVVIPAFVAQGILGFVGGYNSYTGPLLYLGQTDIKTLQLVMNRYANDFRNQYPALCAAALIALTPLLLIYIFCQKFFVEGIAATGSKE